MKNTNTKNDAKNDAKNDTNNKWTNERVMRAMIRMIASTKKFDDVKHIFVELCDAYHSQIEMNDKFISMYTIITKYKFDSKLRKIKTQSQIDNENAIATLRKQKIELNAKIRALNA